MKKNTIAVLALMVATVKVNSICTYPLYQEAIPDSTNKLKDNNL